jgi:hypothetical protein
MRSRRDRLPSPAASPPPAAPVERDGPDALLPPPAAARRLNIAPQTLARWRTERKGPPFYLVGGRVAYRWADIEAWLAARRVAGTGEADAD